MRLSNKNIASTRGIQSISIDVTNIIIIRSYISSDISVGYHDPANH